MICCTEWEFTFVNNQLSNYQKILIIGVTYSQFFLLKKIVFEMFLLFKTEHTFHH